MKHNRFTFSIFLLCCALILAAFAHLGWDWFHGYSHVEVIDRTMPACILTEDGQVLIEELSLKGEQHDFIVNERSSDQFVGAYNESLRIGDFRPEFFGMAWYPEDQDFYSRTYSDLDYSDVRFLLSRDLGRILILTDLQYIDSEQISTPCLVVCPAASEKAAREILTDLANRDLPESWSAFWVPYLP